MRYKLLGISGLRVSEVALGTMFDAYVRAGGNFIDTADRYTDGNSERFVGEFIAGMTPTQLHRWRNHGSARNETHENRPGVACLAGSAICA